jgi:hypothetical protein
MLPPMRRPIEVKLANSTKTLVFDGKPLIAKL